MTTRPSRNRSPSVVFGTISLALLLLIVTALNESQPPPPPTAEYAPQAVQALRDAPDEQTSRSGIGEEGTGGGGGGRERRRTRVVESERVRRCVGDPPRQIEDTQSPPCVAYWEGDNGGRTWKGVTENEVRVAVPAEWQRTLLPLLFTFFNSRFEFYGRKLVPVGVPNCGGWTPSDMKACAASADAQNIFASLSYRDVGGNQQFYYDALAERGIVSVGSHPDRRTEEHLARHAPYQWSYLPSFDKVGRHLASFTCRQLRGRPAAHAGPAYITSPRTFGLIYNTYPDAPDPDLSALRDELAACGITPVGASVEYQQEGTAYQQENEKSRRESLNAITRFSSQGITTVICVCHTSTTKQVVQTADTQGYEPEWVVSSLFYQTGNVFGSIMPQSQWAHAFGLEFWNKQVRPVDSTWYWASQEVDPSYDYEQNNFVYFGALYLYHQLLLLASGVQMAGPKLTPHTFQDGLWNARFPNPDSPYYEGKVGFEDRDHSFVNDAAIVWWDPSGRDPWVGTQGAFCYVRRGERNAIDAYPRRDEAFSPRLCQR